MRRRAGYPKVGPTDSYGRIIGSNEFLILVSKAELIVVEEVRTLSVFKHIVATIPTDNRWYPLM